MANHLLRLRQLLPENLSVIILPVLQSILENESSRAIYLFPTKALAQDQLSDLHELIEAVKKQYLVIRMTGIRPQVFVQKFGSQAISF